MNRLQANICLLCVTLCWSLEVILYACIPSGVPAFATSCVTCLAGAALLFVPFRSRVVAELRDGGWRFFAATHVYPEVDIAFFTRVVFCNTALFPIVFGIPLSGGIRVCPHGKPEPPCLDRINRIYKILNIGEQSCSSWKTCLFSHTETLRHRGDALPRAEILLIL